MQFIRQEIHLDVVDIQEGPIGNSVVDLWVKRLHLVSIVARLQSVPFAPGWLGPYSLLLDRPTPGGASPPAPGLSGSSTSLSLRAVSSQPGEPVGCVRVSLHRQWQASPSLAGWPLPKKRNEAESSSLSLRLAGSPPRASPWGLLLSAPDWLHVGHSFDMLITFQINREARLGLTHQMTQIFADKDGSAGSFSICGNLRNLRIAPSEVPWNSQQDPP
jgi:hypothetical protein